MLDFFLLFIEEMKFCHVIIVIGLDLNRLFIFPAPFRPFTEEKASFGQVGMHDGMDRQNQILMLVIQQIAEVFFDFILQDKRG